MPTHVHHCPDCPPPEPVWLTKPEVCERYRLGMTKLEELIAAGTLLAYRVPASGRRRGDGRRQLVRIRVEDAERMLTDNPVRFAAAG